MAAKRWSLALPHLERARALSPANEDVWFELRTLLLQQCKLRVRGIQYRLLLRYIKS